MRAPTAPASDAISIHALREEGDPKIGTHSPNPAGFLSTPSARRATRPESQRQTKTVISIHALREEGDNLPPAALAGLDGISIHALREEGDAFRSAFSCVEP